MMLEMAKSDDTLQQLVACEAIIAATHKKKDSSMLISQGVDILKQLYKSPDDKIKVRALVGMCKMGEERLKTVSRTKPLKAVFLRRLRWSRRLPPSVRRRLHRQAVRGVQEVPHQPRQGRGPQEVGGGGPVLLDAGRGREGEAVRGRGSHQSFN